MEENTAKEKEEAELTENQQEVWDSLKKTVKRVNGVLKEVPDTTIENFVRVFEGDEAFACLAYNVLSSRPERKDDDGIRDWSATDDAWSRAYIEDIYHMHNLNKWQDALVRFQKERAYNPIKDAIEQVTWDGQSRCSSFLVDWLKVDDTPYSREVSRLIFAGAVRRIYEPGCKFDCVPVLMGSQGSGKSTICHWLAMDDKYYSSISTIQGQKGAEGIQGVWICEIEELLAVLANDKAGSASEEAAKAFISKQDEYYRQPYTKRPEHHPRQCIFIGTTNRETFVTDKTGARRWFPVHVNSVASDIYANEAECKEYILQAWAEMKAAYDNGLPLADPTPAAVLDEEIKKEQASVATEDWRVGIIEEYLEGKRSVCLIQIWEEALRPYQGGGKMGRKDSTDLAEILVNQLHWTRGNTENFGVFKKQKAFHRPEPKVVPINAA